jgi:polysaccharide export outer membrane protein
MLQYRIRPGDELQFIFVKNHVEQNEPYRLMVGDELAISSVTDDGVKLGDVTKGISIQQDGHLYLNLIPPVRAAGLTIEELRKVLEKQYLPYVKTPAINILPIKTNTRLEALNLAISSFQANGGQNVTAVVNPDGRIQLPMIGSIRVIGMTLEEIKREVNLHYANRNYVGLEIEPRLLRQAPHFVFVTGQVRRPGRVELQGPTTVMQALALAEGVEVGGNLRQIVIFRRAEDWRLVATMVDVRGAMLAKRPNPADEIWVRDSDLIIVPPQPIKVFNNWVKLVFTDGIYGVAPAILFSNNNN